MKKILFAMLLLSTVIIVSFTPAAKRDSIQTVNDLRVHSPLGAGLPAFAYDKVQVPAPPTFNAVLFEEIVNKKMKNTVKGYAFAVGDKDGIKARSEGGWAQDPGDGNLRMTTKIPSCIGSVSKMMSSVALLNLLEALPSVKLDDPIFTKLPKKWQQKYKNTQVEWL
ncbi:MAG: serine hydrolase, partial [Chitinophagaceae bacterium]|nr:serine hydrolase [Chitinophagaceae bacterium]